MANQKNKSLKSIGKPIDYSNPEVTQVVRIDLKSKAN